MENSKGQWKRIKRNDSSSVELVPSDRGLVELADLPDLCLLAILERLPVIDLLRVRRVCRRWATLQPVVARQKKSLSIYSYCEFTYENGNVAHGEHDRARIKLDLLRFFDLPLKPKPDIIVGVSPHLLRQWSRADRPGALRADILAKYPLVDGWLAAERLCNAFPAIEQLTLFDAYLPAEHIQWMLARWSHSLVDLRIAVLRLGFPWKGVLQQVDQLGALRHLRLFAVGGLPWHGHVLRQLHTFYFGYHDYYFGLRRACLYRLLGHLDDAKVQHLGVGHFSAHSHAGPFLRFNLRQLLVKRPVLAARLERLKVSAMPPRFLAFLGDHFGSLTCLDLVWRKVAELAALARLPNLSELTLRSNSQPYSASPLDGHLPQAVLLHLPVLASVRRLFLLDFRIEAHLLLRIFPNADVQRAARGDDNPVDYAQIDDLINFNRLPWHRLHRPEELQRVVREARQRVVAQLPGTQHRIH